MHKIYLLSILILKNSLSWSQGDPESEEDLQKKEQNPRIHASSSFQNLPTARFGTSGEQQPAPNSPKKTADPLPRQKQQEGMRASSLPGIIDAVSERIPKSLYSLEEKNDGTEGGSRGKKSLSSLYNLEIGLKRLFKEDEDPNDPGIISEKYKKEIFFLLAFLGYAMCVSGEHYKSFHLSVIIFTYLFSYVIFLFRTQSDIFLLSYFDPFSLFSTIRSSVAGQIVLSFLISVVFSYLFILAIHLFFRLTMILSFLWFVLYGPGYHVISLYSTAKALFFVMLVLFLFFFFILQVAQKRIEVLCLRGLFGFFGSVLLFFAGAEIFGVPMVLPGVLLNYHTKPLSNIFSEGLALFFTTGISVYLQGEKAFKNRD